MGASLEEVVGCLSGDVWFSATRGRIKLEEGVLQGIIQLHDGSLVAAAVAVVGGGEDGHNVPVVGPVVAFHHQLMGPGDKSESIGMVECL